jgi:hypothetical protein
MSAIEATPVQDVITIEDLMVADEYDAAHFMCCEADEILLPGDVTRALCGAAGIYSGEARGSAGISCVTCVALSSAQICNMRPDNRCPNEGVGQ